MVKVQSITSPAVHHEDRAHEADHPSSLVASFGADQPLRLDCGVDFGPFKIAYQTYGRLNPERSNAILICHALSGDQYVAEPHPITAAAGWWTTLVNSGGVLDTERYFLICANVLGGCMGTTGPKDVNPATGEPWALNFPVIADPSHGTGKQSLIAAVSRAAVAVGADGLIIEVHPCPGECA